MLKTPHLIKGYYLKNTQMCECQDIGGEESEIFDGRKEVMTASENYSNQSMCVGYFAKRYFHSQEQLIVDICTAF